ncbi:nucleoside deaminase [Patescibacteria group bacterium]|nr:nucleoside deaminase [Patescibacteria group bacterium]
MQEIHIQKVLGLAQKAFVSSEIPVGAIVLDKSGKIIGKGYNLTHKHKSVLGHAELRALKQAFKKTEDWRLDGCTLMVNLEPCLMCLGAIANSRINKIVYFLADPQFGSVKTRFTSEQLQKLFPKLTIEQMDDMGATKELMQLFFKKLRSKKHIAR